MEGIDNAVLASLFDRLAERHPEILASVGGAGDGGHDGTGSADKRDPVENCGISNTGGAESTGAAGRSITKTDLYLAGLTGGENAAEKRDRLCAHLGFPAGMTPTAFLAALNILYGKEEFLALCEAVFGDTGGAGEA